MTDKSVPAEVLSAYAFVQGYMDRLPRRLSPDTLTNRKIAALYPDYTGRQVEAYAQGVIDSKAKDTFRLNLVAEIIRTGRPLGA